MTTADLVLVTSGLFIAGGIKGATGLGFASCALPFLAAGVGLERAMCLIALPALLTNIGAALTTGHLWETAHRFKWLYLSIFPGVVAGLWLLVCIDRYWAIRGLSISIVSYSVFALWKPNISIARSYSNYLQVPAGFLNGVFTGLTGAQVMPLLPYVMALKMDGDKTVQAINLAVTLASLILTAGLLSTGLLTPELMAFSASAVLPAMAGVEIGRRVRQKIPQQHFRTIVLVVLLLLGAQIWLQ